MKRRMLACLLCLCAVFCALPGAAQAAVLPGMTSKVDYDNTDANRYTIEIDLVNQVITVYENYARGIVLQSLCTTGNAENPTGAGTYKLGQLKERFGYFVAYGQYAQYWTQVVRGIYIHSVMYDSTDLDSMSKSAYRNLGKNLSHGCVRVLPHVAQWIFYNCPPGTTCKVVNNKAKDAALVKQLKAGIPDYADYEQPADAKDDPILVPATIRFDNTPLRTGFSNSRDKTIGTLSAGEHVLLLQLAEDWCKVRTLDGDLGYVKSAYILCEPDDVKVVDGYSATRKTYVYAKMDTESKRLITIPEGGQPRVYDNPKKGWWYGEYNGVEGYMRTKYVKRSTVYSFPELPTDTVTVTNQDGTTSTLTGTTGAIKAGIIANLRALPSSARGSAVLAELEAGTPVTMLGAEGDWIYVSAAGYTGYLHKSCLG